MKLVFEILDLHTENNIIYFLKILIKNCSHVQIICILFHTIVIVILVCMKQVTHEIQVMDNSSSI